MTSIEFRPAGCFTSPLFSTKKSMRRAVKDGVVTGSYVLFVPQRSYLFLGLTDGKILCWEVDKLANSTRGKNDNPSRILDEHKGGIWSMIYVPDLCQGVMFTGSADRCIKMWDLSDPRTAIPCVHSLHGHGGTVLALEYGSEMLLSSSTDGYLCIWRDQSPTKLLRFPVYSIRQKISPEAKAGQGARQPKESWFLSISVREGESPTIIAGDSEGNVHIYRPDPSFEGDQQLFLLAWKRPVHELGVSKILSIPMESFLFTLSYDQKFKTLDNLGGQVIFEESNQCGVIFHGIAWDSVHQDVIVADEKGNIGFYNLYTESCVVWRNLTEDPIIQIHYEPASRRLLLLSPHLLRVVDVVRGVKFSELNEHTGPVVGMASRPTPQGGLLYTAAMDNTIRTWDADTLECIKCLREKKHEVTAMVYLPRANVIITGHENSDLKMWSVDCQMDACLRTVSGTSAHTNTISTLVCALITPSIEESASDVMGPVGWESLIAGSYDRQLSFWKVTLTTDGTAMAKFERAYVAHDILDDEILAVAYCPAASAVFTGGNAGIIRKWAFYGSRQLEGKYEGHEDAVVCFAVDGHFLFSGSVDCTIRIWETAYGRELKQVRLHSQCVQALLVLPDTGLAVSCAFDGKVHLWDPQVGRKCDVREIHVYEQPEEFRSLAYMDVSRAILVGCESGKIITFPLPADTGGADPATAEFSVVPKALTGVETPPSEGDDRDTFEALKMAEQKLNL